MSPHPDRRTLLGASLSLIALPAFAQTDTGLVRVALKTSKGLITVDLDVGKAPITAKNFLRYVDARRYDGAKFYRASQVPTQPERGLIEGGLRSDPAKVFKPIAHESTLKTGLTHKDGTLSMARLKPGTAASEFFICIGDQPGYDADPGGALTSSGDALGFAAFGQVVEGMDVVQAIYTSPTSKTAGAGVMRGEMLSPPVPILSARRVG
jgi:peptidyl-prolyl cis-trans isomerase A (cyclophilin A)